MPARCVIAATNTCAARAQVMKAPKRDQEKKRKREAARRQQVRRDQKKVTKVRNETLRTPQQASTSVITQYVGPQTHDEIDLRKWVPTPLSVVELDGTEERTVIGVHADEVPAMLGWLAPKLARDWMSNLARRNGRSRPRGASFILTTSTSSSGPHKDSEDTLLLNLSGERRVWFASPAEVDEQVPRSKYRAGAPTFLLPHHDPTCNPTSRMVREGVRWREPVTLAAGDAIWIRRGWWHCVQAEVGGVAIPVEVVSGSLGGDAPRVFAHVAPRKVEKWSGRHISRRAKWGSAASVRRLFGV